jgi:hypothetical protein
MIHAGSLAGEELKDPVDPDQYNEAADSAWLPQVRQRLGRRLPAMHQSYGRGGYGALYGITPDWHPILDSLPGGKALTARSASAGTDSRCLPLSAS